MVVSVSLCTVPSFYRVEVIRVPHGEGRGHYGMNHFFGSSLTDKPNTDRGYKSIPYANLENDREPLFMPTKKVVLDKQILLVTN